MIQHVSIRMDRILLEHGYQHVTGIAVPVFQDYISFIFSN